MATSVVCTVVSNVILQHDRDHMVHALLGLPVGHMHMLCAYYSMRSHAPHYHLVHGGGGTSIFGQWNVLGLITKSCCFMHGVGQNFIKKVAI